MPSKILQLPERDRRNVIHLLNLQEPGDDEMLDYKAALAAVRRASERGTLGLLEGALDKWKAARTSRTHSNPTESRGTGQ